MRGVLALILIAGGAILAYAVASGRFPSTNASASSAGNAPLSGAAAGELRGLTEEPRGPTENTVGTVSTKPVLAGGRQVF